MQGNNQGYQPKKIGTGTKAVLWGGGIVAVLIAAIPFIILVAYAGPFLLLGGINQLTGNDYESNIQRGVTASVAAFTPPASWTEISKTEVQKRPTCMPEDRANYETHCEWFRGVWDTNAPYGENSMMDIVQSFEKTRTVKGKPDRVISASCVRATPEAPLEPCRVQTYMSASTGNDSYAFTLTLTDQGPGTDVLATVTYIR